MEKGHSDTTTHGIRVRAAAELVPEHSDADRPLHFYRYRIILSNEGTAPAKLVSRHWIIRDANNEMEEVRGAGVVGEQPEIAPGENFQYESSCPLKTSWGTMEGNYQMLRPSGERFEAKIGRFFLAPTVAPLSKLGSKRSRAR